MAKRLKSLLQQNQKNVWEMDPDQRLIHLSMYRALVENLPFVGKGEGEALTIYKLLLRLAIKGNTQKV